MSDLLGQLDELISSVDDELAFKHELAISAFTNAVAQRLQELGLSQTELAQRLGVSRARVSQIMQHAASPTLRTMVEVASALDCQVATGLAPRGFRLPRLYVTDGGMTVAGYRQKQSFRLRPGDETISADVLAS